MNLLQQIKYYQFSYVFSTAHQHSFLFYNTGIDRRSIATGHAFSTHLYDGPAFSNPAFSTTPPPCKMVSCFPVPRFQSSRASLPQDTPKVNQSYYWYQTKNEMQTLFVALFGFAQHSASMHD